MRKGPVVVIVVVCASIQYIYSIYRSGDLKYTYHFLKIVKFIPIMWVIWTRQLQLGIGSGGSGSGRGGSGSSGGTCRCGSCDSVKDSG